jgi:hypothetical protein
MIERRPAWRRLAAALAGAALLALGTPLHHHAGAASGSEPAVAAQAALATAAHASAGCPACQSSGRTRLGLAPTSIVARVQALPPALLLSAPGAPAAPSAESRPPTPPRGPPSPTA